MIIIPRAFRKCPFCKKTGCDSFAPKYGIYGSVEGETGFHHICLQEVFDSPEVFGHKMVDLAIDLNQRYLKSLKDRKSRLEQKKSVIANARSDNAEDENE